MKFRIDTENKILILETDLTTEHLSQLVKTYKLHGYTIKSTKEYEFKFPAYEPHNSWGGVAPSGVLNKDYATSVSELNSNIVYDDKKEDKRVLITG